MDAIELDALLLASPADHQRRSALARRAAADGRWPAAACGLRHASAMAREWADKAIKLADRCDAEAESGRIASTVAPTLVEIAEPGTLLEQAGPVTIEALEAGLLALAHHLGREHAVHTRRAMANVQRSHAAGV
ncbi:hypothetical protein AVHY2522_24645 [Acidovorax sp. SUPP2522]|uniref:hypothetical protein n=1 Tax=unclassified Acidovorax TaxID=2684926 RepID=UPI002349915A|nr:MULTISPECIES: hypothetical protein [unclassified Acidovorax]WCM96256.1 hypothetical protein M5C96_17695 [Acidovorax sp. GBBC 1281]GKT20050.1 hypothetical protein AVHY2522_24645 [Acidovorax sp. SUPP2522]